MTHAWKLCLALSAGLAVASAARAEEAEGAADPAEGAADPPPEGPSSPASEPPAEASAEPVAPGPGEAAPGGGTAAEPSAEPPPPPSGPPPETRFGPPRAVTEDDGQTEVSRDAAPGQARPAISEPPPPLPPRHRAPKTALWTGVRVGWLLPFGNLWHDGFLVRGACCIYERRAASAYTSSGPLFEIDLGARIGRNYNVFGTWERASLGRGDLDPDAFGGQERGWSDLFGAGVRFSTDPDDVGLVMEIVLGYRVVRAQWEDGTTLTMNDDFLDARIGIGADIRIAPWLSLTPMATLSSGSFNDGTWEGPTEQGPALGRFDERGQFSTATLHVGGHFDIH